MSFNSIGSLNKTGTSLKKRNLRGDTPTAPSLDKIFSRKLMKTILSFPKKLRTSKHLK